MSIPIPVTIEPYRPDDLVYLERFVSAIQEHERRKVPELKIGQEIDAAYADYLLKNVSNHNGEIFMARQARQTIGFICSWTDQDTDQLLNDGFRDHAYISDIYVTPDWRGKGVAQKLINAIEKTMYGKGCQRMRVCSKATNTEAMRFYEHQGYQAYEMIFSKNLIR